MTVSHDIIPRLFTHPAWMATAPCNGLTNIFFKEGRGEVKTIAQAKTICTGCPHRVRCLEYAIDNNEHFGIWGGMSTRERRDTARNRRAMGWTTGKHRNVARGVAS